MPNVAKTRPRVVKGATADYKVVARTLYVKNHGSAEFTPVMSDSVFFAASNLSANGRANLRAALDALDNPTEPAPTRPRVITIADQRFRAVDGVIERLSSLGEWMPSFLFISDDVRKFADLLENPTEEITE